LPHTRLVNLYGPTECCIDTSTHVCGDGDAALPTIPIGRPVPNTRAYVLDSALRPVPAGVPGELCIGGVQVGRAYVNRPALTAERFVPDPFAATPGARMYRTGDRARWSKCESAKVRECERGDTDALTHSRTHALEYLGRLDAQAKIRGMRIEPGEVEAALRREAGVAECAVVVREDVPGDRRLVAYLTAGADPAAARDALRRTLPDAMVPAAFVVIDRIPLTPSGKPDRKSLPAPEYTAAEDFVAPRDSAETALAAIWGEVLRVERVGVRDDFFDLGGHSMLAIRVAARVREAFGVELTVRALFENRTVEGLARWLAERGAAGPAERATPRDASPHHLLSRLDELSEDELDRLLGA
ncbi:MAG TPA: phosphopantetheine-binding protein, partial [Longimicrobium sp.]|nr:phosphopantetheine-binding protein [Longimicrobium sp.]